MKLVTFNRAMAPYQPGETRLVPDDVASRLEAEGALSHAQEFPPRTQSGVPVVAKPEKHRLSLPGRRDRQSYQTK